MIDPAAFAKVMGAFADKIGRPLQADTAALYYDVLSEALDSNEFLAGARVVFRNHSYNTWPAPHQFIDAVKPKGSPALDAGDAFEKLIGAQHPDRIALGLGPVAMRAFRAAGGRREFTAVLESDVHWLRRRFVEAYEHAARVHDAEGQAHVALAAVDPSAVALIDDVSAKLDMKRLPIDHKAIAAGDR